MPFGGPTHERLAPVDDESPQTTSSGDVWTQIQHGTCNSSANAICFYRALTYSPPFFVRAHQTTKEDCTPGTIKASQVALVEPVAYLKDLVIAHVKRSSSIRCTRGCWRGQCTKYSGKCTSCRRKRRKLVLLSCTVRHTANRRRRRPALARLR